ncbi:DNA-3-methyladenine glycosylase [Nocardioides daphniae]|uniref:Putative 3-methyladenine DNA glycosylase n=1 Tax=Nocardioides daphniae TaxID=402297 RepID=A0ABQ1QLM7_9ACTN|nr:DNA-3-methyladenine glycosylase [Nocardioides daphniae]GGD31063.1 putative 3-methyladenine DNA glycosylase [Nocardioides daphniae]
MHHVVDLARPAPVVAPELLGCRLTSHSPDGDVTLVLTEVEAYEGAVDPASHAHRGETPRNAVMFGPAGHAYVYRSHGLHWCLNVVTGTPGAASAVLLRAGRVVDGELLARTRRGAHVAHRSLARGPGNLGQALGITGDDTGSHLLEGPRLRLQLTPDPDEVRAEVLSGPRVGVSRAADLPWRFWWAGEPTVSAYRRSPRATAVEPTPRA